MSTSISGRFKRLGLAGSLAGLVLLGCMPQVGPVGPRTVAEAQRQGLTGTVTISFGKLGDPATWAGNRLRVQAADVVRVNRVRITLMSADLTYSSDQTVPLSLSGNEATFSVPFGKNFIALAQGLNGETEVPGVYVAGYFDIADKSAVNVSLNKQTTPAAEILRYLSVKDSALAQTLDMASLQAMVNQASASTDSSLINPETFAKAIIANKGLPNKPLSNSRFVAGRITGTVDGLDAGEVAIISVSDPASTPFVLVGGGGGDDEGGEYVIDNVVPGTWTVRIVASNATAEEPEQTVTVGTAYVAPTPPPIGSTVSATPTPSESSSTDASVPEVTVDFSLTKTEWSATAQNVSSNVGISDQPDAAVDGVDDIHLVWRQDFNPSAGGEDLNPKNDTNKSGAIFYSRWNGTSWSKIHQNISGIDQQGAREPAIAVGIDRLPHVVWSGLNGDYREIRHTRFDGTTWTKPETISITGEGSYSMVSPDLAVDKINGHVYAVWQGGVKGSDDNYPYFAEWHGSGWTQATRLSSQPGFAPRIATGYDGSIHVAWVSKNPNDKEVRYLRFINGGWDGASIIDFDDLGTFVASLDVDKNTLDMVVDRSNRVHLMWRSGADMVYTFSSAGVWSAPEMVYNGAVNAIASQATIGIDAVGMLHTLWRSPKAGGIETVHYQRRTNEGWKDLASLDAADDSYDLTIDHVGKDRPLVLSDRKGKVHAFWSHKFAGAVEYDIFHLMRTADEDAE